MLVRLTARWTPPLPPPQEQLVRGVVELDTVT